MIISNFGSFGPDPQEINFDDLTTFIGPNGAGKSVALIALCRIFGSSNYERTVKPGDFHLGPNEALTDEDKRNLSIEVILSFPELEKGVLDDLHNSAIPEFFKQMIVTAPKGPPFCRVKLESVWRNTGLIEGDVETNVYWLTSSAEPVPDEHRWKMTPLQRSKILVHYVPASREPSQQIRQSSGTIMHQMLQAIEWTETLREKIENAAKRIQSNFSKEKGIKEIQKHLSQEWKTLYAGNFHNEVALRPVSNDLHEMLKNIELVFSPGTGEAEEKIDKLSDGSKSLFYISLVQSLLKIQELVASPDKKLKGIDTSKLNLPALTLVALEEPENHLCPHYLGRIISGARRISESERCQVVLTSHSPGILKRVEPSEIRYFRLDEHKCSTVNALLLPHDEPADDAYKYVCNGIQAYPELYFSQFVILGEGMSEQIVLPRILDAHGVAADNTFISIVPLGGRHVNHFWRLLKQLNIPHITLLDYDWGREGGRWERIKYACQQLLAIGVERSEILSVNDPNQVNGTRVLSDIELEKIGYRTPPDEKSEEGWRKMLEKKQVFFSIHLDIDWLMLIAFPEQYQALAPSNGGPRIPEEMNDDDKKSVFAAVTKQKKKEIAEIPTWAIAEQLYWYRYLFLGRGKPNTHLRALADIDNKDLQKQCPKVLKRLVACLKEKADVA